MHQQGKPAPARHWTWCSTQSKTLNPSQSTCWLTNPSDNPYHAQSDSPTWLGCCTPPGSERRRGTACRTASRTRRLGDLPGGCACGTTGQSLFPRQHLRFLPELWCHQIWARLWKRREHAKDQKELSSFNWTEQNRGIIICVPINVLYDNHMCQYIYVPINVLYDDHMCQYICAY